MGVSDQPAIRSYDLLSSSSLEYFVPCKAACAARPFLVLCYTHTPGATVVAPEYAPPSLPAFAAASACAEPSQPESINFASACSVSNTKIARKSLTPTPMPAPTEIIFMKVSRLVFELTARPEPWAVLRCNTFTPRLLKTAYPADFWIAPELQGEAYTGPPGLACHPTSVAIGPNLISVLLSKWNITVSRRDLSAVLRECTLSPFLWDSLHSARCRVPRSKYRANILNHIRKKRIFRGRSNAPASGSQTWDASRSGGY